MVLGIVLVLRWRRIAVLIDANPLGAHGGVIKLEQRGSGGLEQAR